MQTIQNRPWEKNAPYSHMLRHYERAVRRLQCRRSELQAELSVLKDSKQGTLESARKELLPKKRIELLAEEFFDLNDAIREIRIYAAKEVH